MADFELLLTTLPGNLGIITEENIFNIFDDVSKIKHGKNSVTKKLKIVSIFVRARKIKQKIPRFFLKLKPFLFSCVVQTRTRVCFTCENFDFFELKMFVV